MQMQQGGCKDVGQRTNGELLRYESQIKEYEDKVVQLAAEIEGNRNSSDNLQEIYKEMVATRKEMMILGRDIGLVGTKNGLLKKLNNTCGQLESYMSDVEERFKKEKDRQKAYNGNGVRAEEDPSVLNLMDQV